MHNWCEDRPASERTILEELQTALALDDNDADVHRILAALKLNFNEHDKAAYHQERALSLNPNSDLIVVQQGELLTWLGRPEEGIEWIGRAMRLNPYHPERFWSHLGRAQYRRPRLWRRDRVLQQADRAGLQPPRLPRRRAGAGRQPCRGGRPCPRGHRAGAGLQRQDVSRHPPLSPARRRRAPARGNSESGPAGIDPTLPAGAHVIRPRPSSTSLARLSRRIVSREIGLDLEAPGVDAGDRCAEPAVAAETLVGKPDHPGVRPRLRADLQQPADDGLLRFVRMSLRQDHQHRRGRTREAGVAVDQEVTHIARVVAERQDRVDVGLLRQHDAGVRVDRVVKPQCDAKVRIEIPERLRLRPFGVENRENVSDAASAVAVELVKTAHGEGGKGKGLHAGTP